jgi:hypothetical protein
VYDKLSDWQPTILSEVSLGCYGTETNSVCRLASAMWRLPLVVNTDGGASVVSLRFPDPGTAAKE